MHEVAEGLQSVKSLLAFVLALARSDQSPAMPTLPGGGSATGWRQRHVNKAGQFGGSKLTEPKKNYVFNTPPSYKPSMLHLSGQDVDSRI